MLTPWVPQELDYMLSTLVYSKGGVEALFAVEVAQNSGDTQETLLEYEDLADRAFTKTAEARETVWQDDNRERKEAWHCCKFYVIAVRLGKW